MELLLLYQTTAAYYAPSQREIFGRFDNNKRNKVFIDKLYKNIFIDSKRKKGGF